MPKPIRPAESGIKQVLADEFDPWEITERASVPTDLIWLQGHGILRW